MGQQIRDESINFQNNTKNKGNDEENCLENIKNKKDSNFNSFLQGNDYNFENLTKELSRPQETASLNNQDKNIKDIESNRVGPGRRKINIEYLNKRDKRNITFSKRKKGIMKKAYELSVLTGSEVLLILGNELGQVYTFATPKLRPILNEEKDFIRQCLHGARNKQYYQEKNMNSKLSYNEYINLLESKRDDSLYDGNDESQD